MTQYVKTLFEEKSIDLETDLGIEGQIGLTVGVVFEFLAGLSEEQQKEIEDMYRKIDFNNGDVLHYTKYLAEGLVKLSNNELQ